MTRRIVSHTLLFLLIANVSFAARRHAALPGGAGRCLYGPIADEAYVFRIAVDATDVYYFDFTGPAVYRVPKNGGLQTLLAVIDPRFFVTDLVVDDTTVFIGTIPNAEEGEGEIPPGAIIAVPKTGGTIRAVAAGVHWPIRLSVDATHVYWVTFGTYNPDTDFLAPDGKVERVRKDGSERQTLAQSLAGPFDLLLDGENVIFSESGEADGAVTQGIHRVPKNGGAVVHLQDTHPAADLAETSTHIVFYGVTPAFDTIGLFRMPKSGGTVELLVDEPAVSGGLHILDGQVYVGVGGDRIQRIPITGGTPQTIVVADFWEPTEFDLDACGIYYGTVSGQLWKAPR